MRAAEIRRIIRDRVTPTSYDVFIPSSVTQHRCFSAQVNCAVAPKMGARSFQKRMRARLGPRAHSYFPAGLNEGLDAEEVENCLLHHIATYITDGLGKRNILRADLDAVLRVAAFLNSAISHQGL